MFPKILKAKYLGGYRLHLTFQSGESGELNLQDDIVGAGGVFAPLEDLDYFAQVLINDETGTIAWPNGVDLDPVVLYLETIHPDEAKTFLDFVPECTDYAAEAIAI
jgi:hypothetical protein